MFIPVIVLRILFKLLTRYFILRCDKRRMLYILIGYKVWSKICRKIIMNMSPQMASVGDTENYFFFQHFCIFSVIFSCISKNLRFLIIIESARPRGRKYNIRKNQRRVTGEYQLRQCLFCLENIPQLTANHQAHSVFFLPLVSVQ